MPTVTVKLYCILLKFFLKRKLQSLSESHNRSTYGVVSRPDETIIPSNPTFSDDSGVATKDLHIDPLSSLSLRIFLPDSAILKNSEKTPNTSVYNGYLPDGKNCRKLPVILQFHGGGWVTGGNDTVGNDKFCRRIARLCDAVVVAVGYRLAPESRYPAAFEDGVRVLNWLGKQGNLAQLSLLSDDVMVGSGRKEIVDGFGGESVEPWLAAHADFSRCVLLGVSCGANIANYVAQYAVDARQRLDPIKVVAQVLMYPFFIGSSPTRSEIKLYNAYLYDKSLSLLAWKLFLPEKEFDLDHPAGNPLNTNLGRQVPLKDMPPTLSIVAEHDSMRDRTIAYSEELRKVNVDAPVLDYKDTIHEFATLDMLLNTPEALACSEDVAIWMKKYISLRGNEFSY